ncbi:MAG: efflux RND transporter periplasmic adaptor subunit [Waddliaceae bacterium]
MRRYIPFFIAFAGMISAYLLLGKVNTDNSGSSTPHVEPPLKPYRQALNGTGIVEAVGKNLSISTANSGIVKEVFVNVWEEVEKDAPLFCVDTKELEAELGVALAKHDVACAKSARLQQQLKHLKRIKDPRAISLDEMKTKENDCLIAKKECAQAFAEIKFIRTRIDCHTIRAPKKGVVIQKNINEGEFLSPLAQAPPIVIGELTELQIRVDIDEQNAHLISPGLEAIAYPKNRPDYPVPLHFSHIEPFVIPKRTLTGQGDERVDTRVLQVIYTFTPPKDFPFYIGQQIDVYIQKDKGNI